MMVAFKTLTAVAVFFALAGAYNMQWRTRDVYEFTIQTRRSCFVMTVAFKTQTRRSNLAWACFLAAVFFATGALFAYH